MQRILHGIRAFQDDVFPGCRSQFERLADGQQPSTLFITCSDSRVPPYTVENSGEAATIEYAVQVLKVTDIICCGHSHCGAITGVLRPESIRGLPAVEKWLVHAEKIRHEIDERGFGADGDDDALTAAIKANVLVQIDHLRTYPAVAAAEASGSLTLHGCFYRFETGEVSAFDAAARRFVPVDKHRSVQEPSTV
jgi:carbonic anhydrase